MTSPRACDRCRQVKPVAPFPECPVCQPAPFLCADCRKAHRAELRRLRVPSTAR